LIDATDFVFSSREDHVRHALWRNDGVVEAFVDYGPGASWEVEQFWPAAGRGLLPGEMMDQNVLVVGDGICSRDDAPLAPMKCVLVGTENQHQCAPDGNSYVDTSSDYVNAFFAPAQIEIGHHEYRSFGNVTFTKHDTPLATPEDRPRQVKGRFEYLITMDVTQDEMGAISVTLLEEFWQAMQDTDKAGYAIGKRGDNPWQYRRFQRYDKGRGLVFLHDLIDGWIAKRFK
jgi:hypothetical protein